MQCRQIVGKRWEIKPSMMKWIYTAMIRPIMQYACVSWAGGLKKKYLVSRGAETRGGWGYISPPIIWQYLPQ